MAFCAKCGISFDSSANYCSNCGGRLTLSQNFNARNVRKVAYEGIIHKCPNCGTNLSSFVKNCPDCGYELRGTKSGESITEFAQKYSLSTSNDKKIEIINSYIIPNTKEDILEFAILASSNISISSYSHKKKTSSDDAPDHKVLEAWIAKFDQAYQKSQLLFTSSDEKGKIETIFLKEKGKIKFARILSAIANNKIRIIVAIICVFLLFIGIKEYLTNEWFAFFDLFLYAAVILAVIIIAKKR